MNKKEKYIPYFYPFNFFFFSSGEILLSSILFLTKTREQFCRTWAQHGGCNTCTSGSMKQNRFCPTWPGYQTNITLECMDCWNLLYQRYYTHSQIKVIGCQILSPFFPQLIRTPFELKFEESIHSWSICSPEN